MHKFISASNTPLLIVRTSLWVQIFSPFQTKTTGTKHLGEPASHFYRRFPVARQMSDRCFGTLWLIHSCLPPFALQSLQRLSAMHEYYRTHRREAFIHYFSCQWFRKQELTLNLEQVQNGGYTTKNSHASSLAPTLFRVDRSEPSSEPLFAASLVSSSI